jgi:hypothetical protein
MTKPRIPRPGDYVRPASRPSAEPVRIKRILPNPDAGQQWPGDLPAGTLDILAVDSAGRRVFMPGWRQVGKEFLDITYAGPGCALGRSLAAVGIEDGYDRLLVVAPQMELFA